MALADEIRAKRKAKGWSQIELAERLKISHGAVGLWETGGGITLENLVRLRDLIGLRFGDEGTSDSPTGYQIVQDPEKLAWLTLFDLMDASERAHVARMIRGSASVKTRS